MVKTRGKSITRKIRKRRVNISVHPIIHDAFVAWCQANGKIVSQQIESFMARVATIAVAKKVRKKVLGKTLDDAI